MNHRFRHRPRLQLLSALFTLTVSTSAIAATVKGTVSLPTDLRTPRRFTGHWRVEGTLPMAPVFPRGDTVVVLTGIRAQTVPPKTVTIDIAGLQANPPTSVVIEGSVVEFKNSDKVTHDLVIPGQTQIMAPERLSPGAIRKVRFAMPGEYLVHCTEYPHIVISIIVTNSPLYSIVDEKGAFHLPDSPEGKGVIKVWSNGRWVYEKDVEITPQGLDLNIKVASSNPQDSVD
jgi:plastocyanin